MQASAAASVVLQLCHQRWHGRHLVAVLVVALVALALLLVLALLALQSHLLSRMKR
jgi:hypothetical protein